MLFFLFTCLSSSFIFHQDSGKDSLCWRGEENYAGVGRWAAHISQGEARLAILFKEEDLVYRYYVFPIYVQYSTELEKHEWCGVWRVPLSLCSMDFDRVPHNLSSMV